VDALSLTEMIEEIETTTAITIEITTEITTDEELLELVQAHMETFPLLLPCPQLISGSLEAHMDILHHMDPLNLDLDIILALVQIWTSIIWIFIFFRFRIWTSWI